MLWRGRTRPRAPNLGASPTSTLPYACPVLPPSIHNLSRPILCNALVLISLCLLFLPQRSSCRRCPALRMTCCAPLRSFLPATALVFAPSPILGSPERLLPPTI